MTKVNGGTVQLNNSSNNYGGTVLTDGELLLGTFGVLGSGSLTVTGASRLNVVSSNSYGNAVILDGASLTVDRSGVSLELDGLVSGTGGLNVSNGGELILGVANTYGGVTQLTNGTLGVRDGLAAGGGAHSIISVGGTLKSYGTNLTVGNQVRVNGGFTVDTNNEVLTLSGLIRDVNAVTNGALNVTGGGTLILAHASNSYTLGTKVSGATLQVSSDAQLGNGTAGITLEATSNEAGLTIDGTAFGSTARTLTLSGLTNLTVLNAAANLHLALVTGSGDLHKEGPGAISLTGTNSYGNTYANGGVINFDSNLAFGSAGTIILAGGNIVTTTNALTLANNIALVGGEIQAGNNNLTLSGTLYSVGELTKTGLGTFNLNHTNTYSGGTHVIAGALNVGADNALGTSTATFDNSTRLTASADVTLTNAIVLNTHVDVDGGGHTLTLASNISGDGLLHMVYNPAGTVVLSGVNTYTGSTLVSQGTLEVDSSAGTGDTAVESSGFLQGTGTLAATTTIDAAGTLSPGNGVGTIHFTNLTLANFSTVNFELGAPGTTGSGVNDYIIVSGDLNLGSSIFNFTGLAGFSTGTYRLIDYSGVYSGTDAILGTKPAGYTYNITHTDNHIDLTVAALAAGPQYWDGANVTANNFVNGGTATWNAASTNWTNAGGTTNASWSSDTAIFDGLAAGVVTVAGTQNFNKLQFNLTGYTLTAGTLHATGAGEVNVATNVVATINSTISGNVGLTKTGAGTLALGGTNSMTGGVTVNQGTLEVTASQALGIGALTVGVGTINKLNVGFINDIHVLGTGGTGATFDVTPSNIVLSGVITGTGKIIKTGIASLGLSGDNSGFSGGIDLTNGRLDLLSSNAAGTGPITTTGSIIAYANGITSVAPLIINSDATELAVFAGDKATQAGAISELNGPRSIFKIGGGNLVLTGANTITGDVIINDGTLTVAGGNNLGSGTVAANADVRLNVGLVGSQAITIANDIYLAGQLTVGLAGSTGFTAYDIATGLLAGNGNTVTLAGQITGAGSLTTDEASRGNLIIAGTNANGHNTYSGGTTLNYSVASIGANDALGTGTVTLGSGGGLVNNSGGALTLAEANAITVASAAGFNNSLGGANDLTLNGAVTGSSTIIYKLGGGTLTLANAANSVHAAISVYTGTLRVDGALTNASTSVDVLSGSTLQGIGSIAGAFTIENGGTLAPGDSPGTLTVGSLLLNNGSLVDYQLGEANVLSSVWNDRTVVTGALTLDGLLTVTDSHAFGLGVYNLFTYGGALTDHGLDVVTLPGGYTGTVETLVTGQVNLIVTKPGDLIQYWDGSDMTGEVPGTVLGGSGVWNNLNTNWTSDPFQLNASWQSAVAIFAGASAGTVELQENENFLQLQFQVDGYHVTATGAGGLTVTAGDIIQTATGVTATIDATIGGVGSITKQGLGNLVLNAANTYTGNTNLVAGTITAGNNAALGIGALVMADQTILAAGIDGLAIGNNVTTTGGARIDTKAFTTTLTGQISGPGSISHIGLGNLILNGDNSFHGLGINQGTVTLGQNTSAGVGRITINDQAILAAGVDGLVIANTVETTGGARVDTKAFTMTLNGQVGGVGSLSHIGTGNLILNGANSFHGLGINQGTVTLGQNTSGGVGTITINDQAILAAGADNLVVANTVETTGGARVDTKAFTMTLNGQVGGLGSLSQVGTGNLVLNGANSFHGLGINQGAVTLGQNTSAGVGTITINNNAILAAGVDGLVVANIVETTGGARVDTKAFTMTLNGQVGGVGSLSHIGLGNLVLNGANSFHGLGINQGTVTLGQNTSGGVGTITINDQAILAAGADNLVIANNVETTGGGRVDTKAFTMTLNGQVSGVGSLSQVGIGNLILNGNNSFAAGLGINAGTVTLGTNTAAGTGTITINDDAILGAGVDGLVIANNVETTGGGRVDTKAFTMTLNGQVGGVGSLSQAGTGNLILNGANSFHGLGINSGTVTLGQNTSGGVGTITINDNAILAAGVDGLVIANNVETTGGGRVDTEAFTMTLNGQVGGVGSLSQAGTGNLILNGANSFHGLGINSGTVTLGQNTSGGVGTITINDNAILAAGVDGLVIANNVETTGGGRVDTEAFTMTLNGQVGGVGSISQVGIGNLILNGKNSFAAGLGINAGTVTLGTNTAAGTGTITINDNAILAAGVDGLVIANSVETTGGGRVDTKAFTMTLSGPVGGLGSLSQVGSGNLVLNGANSFQGLGINAGTVTLGQSTSGGVGTITINDQATLKAGATGLTVANDIETTDVGRVDSGAGVFTLSGHIGNSGGITKVGAGTLFLTNTSNYAGGTTVAAGRLNVTGALTKSTVTVGTGGTLGGTGSVAGLVVQAGGTVAPGLSLGILTVNGNATFAAGSTYAAEISGVTSDKLVVTGTAALNGANIVLVAGASPAIFGTTYQILTAAGGRTGTFTPTTTGYIQAFKPTLIYSATDVKLLLAPASIVGLLGTGGAGSSNITNIAAAFDASVTAGFNPQNFFNIFLQSGGALGASLNQLTGEISSADSRTAMADTRYVREAALDRLGASLGGTGGATNGVNTTGTDEHNVSVWARGIGSWTTSSSDGNGSHLSIDAKGVITGVDASFGDWKVGGLFNYLESNVDTRGLGKGKVKSTGGGIYGGYRGEKGIAFGIGGAASHVRSSESRTVSFPGTSQGLTGKTGGTSYQAFGEISYDLAAAANTRVEPFFRAAYVEYKVDAFNEAGGFAGLNVAKDKYDTTYLTAGLRGSILLGSSAWLKGSAGYQRTTGDRSPVSLVTIQGTSSQAAIRGVALDKSAFAGELGVDVNLAKNVSLGAGYSGVLGKNTKDNGVKATLTVGF